MSREGEYWFWFQKLRSLVSAGDCDDCAVLYYSLLENLNIPTAFVDAPDHILMMFDSGVSVQREFGFSLDPSLYIEREGRFWIPVGT